MFDITDIAKINRSLIVMNIHPTVLTARQPRNTAEHSAVAVAGKRIARCSHHLATRGYRLKGGECSGRIGSDISNAAEAQIPQMTELRLTIAHHLAHSRSFRRRKT